MQTTVYISKALPLWPTLTTQILVHPNEVAPDMVLSYSNSAVLITIL